MSPVEDNIFLDGGLDRYLILCRRIGRREKPEEQTRIAMGRVGQETRITLADVKWNLREMSPVHKEA